MCFARGIDAAIPIVRGDVMQFARFDATTPLTRGTFGLEEPLDPERLAPTVILLPLVAFDRTGARLGRGGGYYDRYLSERPDVRAIGVAHGAQEHVGHLPREPHDVVLTEIVTEKGWITIGK